MKKKLNLKKFQFKAKTKSIEKPQKKKREKKNHAKFVPSLF